jgi:hypothetical protein
MNYKDDLLPVFRPPSTGLAFSIFPQRLLAHRQCFGNSSWSRFEARSLLLLLRTILKGICRCADSAARSKPLSCYFSIRIENVLAMPLPTVLLRVGSGVG